MHNDPARKNLVKKEQTKEEFELKKKLGLDDLEHEPSSSRSAGIWFKQLGAMLQKSNGRVELDVTAANGPFQRMAADSANFCNVSGNTFVAVALRNAGVQNMPTENTWLVPGGRWFTPYGAPIREHGTSLTLRSGLEDFMSMDGGLTDYRKLATYLGADAWGWTKETTQNVLLSELQRSSNNVKSGRADQKLLLQLLVSMEEERASGPAHPNWVMPGLQAGQDAPAEIMNCGLPDANAQPLVAAGECGPNHPNAPVEANPTYGQVGLRWCDPVRWRDWVGYLRVTTVPGQPASVEGLPNWWRCRDGCLDRETTIQIHPVCTRSQTP